MNKRILFVSHKKSQCGVYEFGKSITDVLQHSKKYQFIRVECSSLVEMRAAIKEYAPAAIIYNYTPSVLPWITTRIAPKVHRNNIAFISIPQIGIIHEITQSVADTATTYKNKILFGSKKLTNSLFDYYIAPDPTLLLKNPCVFKTGRLIPAFQNTFQSPKKLVVGSFGFGTPNKGFEKIVQLVQREFDEAVIRFNIPSAEFGDKEGVQARAIAKACRAIVTKPGIEITITHEFWGREEMLNFLAQNTINMFLYEDKCDRGLSSALDNALAVQRPVAVSDAVLFRHVHDTEPSVCVSKTNLKAIIQNGFSPLRKHFEEWNAENLLWEYERILDSIFSRQRELPRTRSKNGFFGTLRSKFNRLLSRPDKTFTWLRSTDCFTQDDLKPVLIEPYHPIQIPQGVPLNRILDEDARKLYSRAIERLSKLAPVTMGKKIPEANVQQAFVFDTVCRYLVEYQNPTILCVGSYEDTASISLIKSGIKVDEIDPTQNYSLQEYCSKPSANKKSYDIIFSTSVIEHDPDDESFITCLSDLLAPNGVAILTCDFKDGWTPNEPKPDCIVRFYTQRDLRERLLPLMKKCHLVDEPQWNCPNPDFIFENYQYAFASFVVRKEK